MALIIQSYGRSQLASTVLSPPSDFVIFLPEAEGNKSPDIILVFIRQHYFKTKGSKKMLFSFGNIAAKQVEFNCFFLTRTISR